MELRKGKHHENQVQGTNRPQNLDHRGLFLSNMHLHRQTDQFKHLLQMSKSALLLFLSLNLRFINDECVCCVILNQI